MDCVPNCPQEKTVWAHVNESEEEVAMADQAVKEFTVEVDRWDITGEALVACVTLRRSCCCYRHRGGRKCFFLVSHIIVVIEGHLDSVRL